MSQISLAVDGVEKGTYSRAQVEAMYLAGTIMTGTLYWTEGMTAWLPVDELFPKEELKQPITQPLSTPRAVQVESYSPTKNHPRKYYDKEPKSKASNIVLVMFLVSALAGLGYWIWASPTAHLTQQSSALNPEVPIEIRSALNDIKSATDGGLNRDDYANLLAKLKSSIATNGANLSGQEGDILNGIVENYNLVLTLIDKSHDDNGQSIVHLDLSDPADVNLERKLEALKVESTDESKENPNYRDYYLNVTATQLFQSNNSDIDTIMLMSAVNR